MAQTLALRSEKRNRKISALVVFDVEDEFVQVGHRFIQFAQEILFIDEFSQSALAGPELGRDVPQRSRGLGQIGDRRLELPAGRLENSAVIGPSALPSMNCRRILLSLRRTSSGVPE